jgi:hypothetical protein
MPEIRKATINWLLLPQSIESIFTSLPHSSPSSDIDSSVNTDTSSILHYQTLKPTSNMSSRNTYQDLDSSRDSQEDSQLLDTSKLEEAMTRHKATVKSPTNTANNTS